MSWRRHWLVGNWLGAFPLIRIAALPSWQQIVFALGADLLMITGMVVGMDLGSDEVAFLSRETATTHDGAFGHLIGATITLTMVMGMAAGMILWSGAVPLLGLAGSAHSRRPATGGWRGHPLARHGLAHVPALRAVCEPLPLQACLALCADAFLIAGMLVGMAMTHELALESATPVRGLPIGLLMAVGLSLGIGAGQAAWNTISSITRTCVAILAPDPPSG